MEKAKKFGASAWVIVCYFAISTILMGIGITLQFRNEIFNNIVLIFASTYATGFVVYKFREKLKGQWGNFKKNAQKYLRIAAKNWLFGLVLMMISNAILIALLGDIAPNEESIREIENQFFFYSLMYVCVLAPVAEELLFRLNFKDVFEKERIFLWVTSLLFGGMHVIGNVAVWTDVLYIIPYAILGYYFGKTYIETKNIYASISAHMAQNILAMFLSTIGI